MVDAVEGAPRPYPVFASRILLVVVVSALPACGMTRGEVGSSRPGDPDVRDATPDAPAATPMDASLSTDAGGVPPTQCFPRCIWDLLSACTPPPAAQCNVETGNGFRKICDPSTGWIRTEWPGGGQFGKGIDIYNGTELCVEATWGGASPVPAFLYRGMMQSHGLLGFDGKTASCDLAGHLTELETDRPECAPWRWNDASPPMPELTCETMVPGPCDMPLGDR